MRILCLSLLFLGLAVGCGEPPAPVGPAAEASISDIEITMDEPAAVDSTTANGSAASSESTEK